MSAELARLKNGAEVIAYTRTDKFTIVLAKQEDQVQPFVTWAMEGDDCFWGHYFKSFDNAKLDYAMRCQRGF